MPIEYILGRKEFCNRTFFVDKNVLIPREDTEVLVEAVIARQVPTSARLVCGTRKSEKIDKLSVAQTVLDFAEYLSVPAGQVGLRRVLDLCTGSGCVGVTLALAGYAVVASDVSAAALGVARRNAEMHNVEVEFIQSDMFTNISEERKFDIIVSNPPYIKTDEIGLHDPGILHEPRLALDGGADGLWFYGIIAREAGKYLVAGGMLALEIGYDQSAAVRDLLLAHGWGKIKFIKDRHGHERVIIATCPDQGRI